MTATGPTLAVIGGSRAYDLLARNRFGVAGGAVRSETPYGPSAPLHLFSAEGTSFYFLSRHGESGYELTAPYVNYRANIWALKEKGVERVVSWSGPGAVNPGMKPGDLVVPHDIIDQTKCRPFTFFENTGLGFIRMSEPFCPEVRSALHASAVPSAVAVHNGGVYCCTEGPRLETPAEIKMFAGWGADLVGMTLVPEAFLAREMEICYASLCYVTNYAEGVRARVFREGELFEGMQSDAERDMVEKTLDRMPEMIGHAVRTLSAAPRSCDCRHAMARYRKAGKIDNLLDIGKKS